MQNTFFVKNYIESNADQLLSLQCLANVVIRFGNGAVAIIPQMLNVAVTLIESAFGHESDGISDKVAGTKEIANGHSKIKRKRKEENKISRVEAMTEVAIRTCVSMIEHVPFLFGQNSLQRFTGLVVRNEDVKVLQEVLKIGMQELPRVTKFFFCSGCFFGC